MRGSLVVASMAIAGIRPSASNFGANSPDSSIWALSLRVENGLGEVMAGRKWNQSCCGVEVGFGCVWKISCVLAVLSQADNFQ